MPKNAKLGCHTVVICELGSFWCSRGGQTPEPIPESFVRKVSSAVGPRSTSSVPATGARDAASQPPPPSPLRGGATAAAARPWPSSGVQNIVKLMAVRRGWLWVGFAGRSPPQAPVRSAM